MNVPPQGPDAGLHREAYDFYERAHLVHDPETAPNTVRTVHAERVANAAAKMGHVALLHKDKENYHLWQEYTEHYLDTLKLRPDAPDSELLSRQLVYSYLSGTTANDFDASQKLHEHLEDDKDYSRLYAVVSTSGRLDLLPDGWIAQYAALADVRANAWQSYAQARYFLGLNTGTTLSVWNPGMARSAQELIDGHVSPHIGVNFAEVLFRFMPDPQMRRNLLERVNILVNELAENPPEPRMRRLVHLMSLARRINVATDISLPDKQHISDNVSRAAEQLIVSTEPSWIYFKLSCDIAAGRPIRDLIGQINETDSLSLTAASQSTRRDDLMAFAAETYCELSALDDAAIIIASMSGIRLRAISTWGDALFKFVDSGGDPGRVQLADRMRQIMDEEGAWEQRSVYCEAASALAFGKGEDVAGHIEQLIEKASASPRSSAEFTLNLARRFAAKDPAAFKAVGGRILNQTIKYGTQFAHHEELCLLLTKHSVPNALKACWRYLQESARTKELPVYFADYANLALTAAKAANTP